MTDAATMDANDERQAGSGEPDGAARPGRRRIGQILKIALTLLVVAAIAYFVVDQWDGIRDTWRKLTWTSLLLSTVAAMVGMAASSAGWRDAARDIGSPVGFLASARVFVIGQLGKYVPGSLWMYVLQTELGRRAGVPRARAFLASMIAMGTGITAALVVGVASGPSLLRTSGVDSGDVARIRAGVYVMVALLPIALVCCVPAVLTALVRVALRVLRRPGLTSPLTWSGISRVLGWNLLTYLCFGAHLWFLVPDATIDGYPRCVGAFAVALVVGMFALTPGGAGVRELFLVVALAPFLAGGSAAQTAAATGIALASRVVFFVAELVGAGLAALTDADLTRRLRPGSRGRAEEPAGTDQRP